MPRRPRLVVPEVAHHIVQRGNRRQRIFFGDDDRSAYIDLLAKAMARHQVKCLAWCLMENHVHLALVPPVADALRATLSSVHTAYSQRINRQHDVSGHLFQGRYASYPMDDRHMAIAVRYIENNPVAAGMVDAAAAWRWSSARAHLGLGDDGLTDVSLLAPHIANWPAYLRQGVEAADMNDAVERALARGLPMAEAAEARPRGRPKKGDSPLFRDD
jgi:putative transposase